MVKRRSFRVRINARNVSLETLYGDQFKISNQWIILNNPDGVFSPHFCPSPLVEGISFVIFVTFTGIDEPGTETCGFTASEYWKWRQRVPQWTWITRAILQNMEKISHRRKMAECGKSLRWQVEVEISHRSEVKLGFTIPVDSWQAKSLTQTSAKKIRLNLNMEKVWLAFDFWVERRENSGKYDVMYVNLYREAFMLFFLQIY